MRIIRHFSQKVLINQKGMTLIEVMVGISIATIILAALMFIFLTTNRTYNTLMASYDINSMQIMILEHIKERGVADAISLTLLAKERQNPSNDENTNWIKWQDNSLYFNNNVVYNTSINEDINVYFENNGNILTIIIMTDNNYVTSDIFLFNLNNGLIQEEGDPLEGHFTIIEWSTMPKS